jgi:hypothetical protein
MVICKASAVVANNGDSLLLKFSFEIRIFDAHGNMVICEASAVVANNGDSLLLRFS